MLPTLSNSFSINEEEITQSTIHYNSGTEEENNDSIAVDSLLLGEEETLTLGFLKPFCFWLAIVIGGLAGLAFTIAVLTQGSNYIKKR